MNINLQKEQFSNAYIQAVTTVAGYSLYRPDIDDDSVDLGIAAKNVTGIIISPRLELQLKCTSRDLVDSNYIRYPLKLKNYGELREMPDTENLSTFTVRITRSSQFTVTSLQSIITQISQGERP